METKSIEREQPCNDCSSIITSKLNTSNQKQKVIGFKLSPTENINSTSLTTKEKRVHTTTKLPVMMYNNRNNSLSNKNLKSNRIQGENEREEETISNEHNIVRKQDIMPLRSNNPGSEMNYATSPESFLDNVLSAASSISIQSDSVSNLNVVVDFHNINTSEAIEKDTTTMPIQNYTGDGTQYKIRHDVSINKMDPGISSLKKANNLLPLQNIETMPNCSAKRCKAMNTSTTILDYFGTARNRSRSPSRSIVEKVACGFKNKSANNNSTNRKRSLEFLIDGDFKCSLCGDIYTDPRTLNCLHTFCLQCLIDEYSRQNDMVQTKQLINSVSKSIPKGESVQLNVLV